MRRATILLAVGAAILLAAPSAAVAQTSDEVSGFLAVYGGAQPQRHDFTATQSFPLFDETANISTVQRIRNSGMGGVGVGFPVSGALLVGGRITFAGRPGSGVVTAVLPDPAFFDKPKTVTLDADDLKHTELGIHINVLYKKPLSPKLNLWLSGGPSIIHVKQGIATTTVSNAGIATVSKEEQSGNAIGGNGGADVMYSVKPTFGIGVFVHYAAGKAKLDAGDLTVGGVQTGVALHIGL